MIEDLDVLCSIDRFSATAASVSQLGSLLCREMDDLRSKRTAVLVVATCRNRSFVDDTLLRNGRFNKVFLPFLFLKLIKDEIRNKS